MILKKLCTHGLCFYTLIFVTTLKIGAQVPFYGKVLSENKEPMENVNVIIRHIPDSTLLTIAITDVSPCNSKITNNCTCENIKPNPPKGIINDPIDDHRL